MPLSVFMVHTSRLDSIPGAMWSPLKKRVKMRRGVALGSLKEGSLDHIGSVASAFTVKIGSIFSLPFRKAHTQTYSGRLLSLQRHCRALSSSIRRCGINLVGKRTASNWPCDVALGRLLPSGVELPIFLRQNNSISTCPKYFQ